MNGRLYDPYLQRFLSPDPFVQSPMNPQNYNRYSYVLNNPLMYTDPSGYFHGSPEERQASRAAILQWRNAWMNVIEPPGGSGNSNLPFGYHGSFRESQETVNNWQSIDNQFNNNSQPGLIDWLSGVMIPGVYDIVVTDGHFIFKHESGKHIIDITNYFVQAGKSGNNSRDITSGEMGMPWWAADVKIGIGGFNAANGLKSELIEYAIRSNYKTARTWGKFNNLRSSQQAWRTINTLGKTGVTYLKYVKGLGYVGAGLTTTYSAANAGMYYYNGGTDWQVGAKVTLDVIMIGVGFLGPIGFGISATYFILDSTTGGFGGFGEI